MKKVIKWTKEPHKATKSVLEGYEKQCNISLPPLYRNFIQRQNGGEPEPNYFAWEHPKDGTQWAWIDKLFVIAKPSRKQGAIDSTAQWAYETFIDHMGADLVPIGSGASLSDLYAVGVGKYNADIIYIKEIENYLEEPKFYKVASSILDFIKILEDDPGDEAFERNHKTYIVNEPKLSTPSNPLPRHRRGKLRGQSPDFGVAQDDLEYYWETPWGKMRDVGPELSVREITLLAKKMKVQLPKDLTESLYTCNGGQPFDKDIFECDRPDGAYLNRIHYLYGSDSSSPYRDMEAWNSVLSVLLPKGWITVGATITEDQVVICVEEGEHFGFVCLWDAYSKSKNPEKTLFYISDTYDEFLSILCTGFDDE